MCPPARSWMWNDCKRKVTPPLRVITDRRGRDCRQDEGGARSRAGGGQSRPRRERLLLFKSGSPSFLSRGRPPTASAFAKARLLRLPLKGGVKIYSLMLVAVGTGPCVCPHRTHWRRTTTGGRTTQKGCLYENPGHLEARAYLLPRKRSSLAPYVKNISKTHEISATMTHAYHVG